MWPLTWPRNVKKSQQSFESSQTVMIATYCNTTLSDTTHEHLIILLGHDVKHVEKCFSAKLAQMRLAKASFSPVAGVQDMKQTRGVFLVLNTGGHWGPWATALWGFSIESSTSNNDASKCRKLWKACGDVKFQPFQLRHWEKTAGSPAS